MIDLREEVSASLKEVGGGAVFPVDGPEAFLNRELSWLAFARRVLSMAEDPALPLLERVKFLGIVGMLHDEFFMKRIGGLKRQVRRGVVKRSLDGRQPSEELAACQAEIRAQVAEMDALLQGEIRLALEAVGLPILDHERLAARQKRRLQTFFTRSVLPILTPLAVDSEHPFPFISNLGLNLAVRIGRGGRRRFVRLKVPANRDRWVPVAGSGGVVPLEQVIAANLGQLFPRDSHFETYVFSVTRGAEGESEHEADEDGFQDPGSIIRQVSNELKARRFAGVVRLQVEADMPVALRRWLARSLEIGDDDIYPSGILIRLADLITLPGAGREDLKDPTHVPVTHPRLERLDRADADGVFDVIRAGDVLLHHPYQSFDTSVLRFLEVAASDPRVLAIKLTIYRTSSDSPIVRLLAEAARSGKQVAVLVEITARFDEAPNIAWGRLLEREGVHVAYGVEKLKTHVKLALVVREEADGIRRYVHFGTGNYHTGTARIYEDLGILSCNERLSREVAAIFNELTGATTSEDYRTLLVAPRNMRTRFLELIAREANHAAKGRPCGIRAKMNQLQDAELIRALYRASQAGVPISLNVRGLCCLRPGVPGMSETIRVFSVMGRFLEHGRIYRFTNGGSPATYIGSADWMKRNLDGRVETIAPVLDPQLKEEVDEILTVLENDNSTAWDLQPDGSYRRRAPATGEPCRAAQQIFMDRARQGSAATPT